MFKPINRLTENFRLTGLSINRTETGNMATALSVKNNFCAVKSKYTIYKSSLIWVYQCGITISDVTQLNRNLPTFCSFDNTMAAVG